MKITKLQGLTVLSMLAVSTFTSCEEHNPFSEQELFEQEYSKNFFKTYGQFPAGQNWDFSNAPRTAPTDPSVFDLGSGMDTRAVAPTNTPEEGFEEVSLENAKKTGGILSVPEGDPGTATDPYYYLEKDTYDWLQEHLVEGANNTTVGSPFTLVYGSDAVNKFAIIPFFQGYGTVKYKLHLVSVENRKDYVIWDNWEVKEDDDYSKNYVNTAVGTSDFQWNRREENPTATSSNWANVDKGQRLDELGRLHHNDDTGEDVMWHMNIRSKPMIISGLRGEFYFYMEVTYCISSYGQAPLHHTSKEGMMLALPCPAPKNINNYKKLFGISDSQKISQVMVIGCEDTKKSSDWDFNDIAFLIVGLTDLPQRREAKHSKRYLIEDLGTTVDFDFNDVVVDVTETVMIDPATEKEEIYTQEAVIRHLCGTVPFQVSFTDLNNAKEVHGGSFPLLQGIVQGLTQEYKYNKDTGKYDPNGRYVKLQYSKKGGGQYYGDWARCTHPFWDYEMDNIQINVGSAGDLEGINWSELTPNGYGGFQKTAGFQRPADKATNAPYIIAVPTTQMWTEESKSFPIDKYTSTAGNYEPVSSSSN